MNGFTKRLRVPLVWGLKCLRPSTLVLPFKLMHLVLLLRRSASTRVLFFFPFYHIGGAEKVHAAIVSTAGDSLVFFTRRSSNRGFYDEFHASSTCMDIS